MSARRCLMDRQHIETTRAVVCDDSTLNYLGRSLRLRPGDHIEFFDGYGLARLAEIETTRRDRIEARWLEAARQENRLFDIAPVPIIARLKSHAEDDAIAALSAMGFPQIRLFRADRDATDKPWTDKQSERWRRIAGDSCRQSGGYWRSEIASYHHLGDAIEGLDDLAYGDPSGGAFGAYTSSSLGIVIGPEGGLSPDERQLLSASQAQAVQLGPHTLRARHAASLLPVVALSQWRARP